jgi:hypothetical protein
VSNWLILAVGGILGLGLLAIIVRGVLAAGNGRFWAGRSGCGSCAWAAAAVAALSHPAARARLQAARLPCQWST